MSRQIALALGLAAVCAAAVAQTPPVVGDHSTPLRPVAGEGNTGISNAVLRDQAEVRALRVMVEAGGTRAVHAHNDVRFHLFVPISDAMTLQLESGPVQVQPWHPYYMSGGTQHGFHNGGSAAVEIMEIFVR